MGLVVACASWRLLCYQIETPNTSASASASAMQLILYDALVPKTDMANEASCLSGPALLTIQWLRQIVHLMKLLKEVAS